MSAASLFATSRAAFGPAPAHDPTSAPHHPKRSSIARIAVTGGLGVAAAGKLSDYGRIFASAPYAIEHGYYGRWLLYSGLGKALKPVVRMEGGIWGKLFRVSTTMSAITLPIGIMVATPNLIDGLRSGPTGLYNTRSGRTGLIQGIESSVSLSTLLIAALPGWRGGIKGMDSSLMKATWRASLALAIPNLVLSPLVPLNELGMFDGLNAGDRRSVLGSMRDSAGTAGQFVWSKRTGLGVVAAITGAVSVRAGLHAGQRLPVAVGAATALAGVGLIADGLVGL